MISTEDFDLLQSWYMETESANGSIRERWLFTLPKHVQFLENDPMQNNLENLV